MPRLSSTSSYEDDTPSPPPLTEPDTLYTTNNEPSCATLELDCTKLCIAENTTEDAINFESNGTVANGLIVETHHCKTPSEESDVDNDVVMKSQPQTFPEANSSTLPGAISSTRSGGDNRSDSSESSTADGGKISSACGLRSDAARGNKTTRSSVAVSPRRRLRKRYTASDELDVLQLQVARDESSSDPAILLKMYQVLSLGYTLRFTSSPYIREILSNCETPSEAYNYRRSYILEGSS